MRIPRRYQRHFISIMLLFVVTWLWVDAAQTQAAETKPSEAASGRWTVESLRRLSSEADAALKAARQFNRGENAGKLGIEKEALDSHVRKWVDLEAIYDGLLSKIREGDELGREAAAVRKDREVFQQRGLLKKPPYALSYYDALLVESQSLRQRAETTDMALKAAQRNLEAARTRVRDTRDRLQAQKGEQTPGAGARGVWMQKDLELDLRLAEAMQRLDSLRIDNLQLQKQIAMDRADLVDEQVDEVRVGLAYDERDLNAQIDALEQKKRELQKALDLLKKKKRTADRQWLNAQDGGRQSAYATGLTGIENQLRALDQWRKTYQEAIDQHEEMLRLADQQQWAWNRRYDLLKKIPDRATLSQWYEQSQQRLDRIDRVLPIEQQRQNSLWQQTAGSDTSAGDADRTPNHESGNGFAQALRQMAVNRLAYIGMLAANRGLEERLSREIDLRLERQPFKYQVEKFWARVRGIWNFQVWTIGDRPLTVQMILVALVILLLGIMTTKIVIHRIAKRLLARPQIKPTTAATIEKLLLYFGYLLVVLFALRIVNIPLAAFAFLGGAVAIGLGFGAQNLINNFISGFIIMGEQPINIGDLIEVEGVLGQVEEIGARCTRIRTGENIRILVPNSSFLEKNITNWTLSDRLIRADVTVGVAYGSPVEQVEDLLLRACTEFAAIRKSPEPFVLFTDFGDNALIFKILFWINVNRVIERRLIESKLRFRIDALFREADIVIAFPQRDVHLDSSEPLKIRVLKDA